MYLNTFLSNIPLKRSRGRSFLKYNTIACYYLLYHESTTYSQDFFSFTFNTQQAYVIVDTLEDSN